MSMLRTLIIGSLTIIACFVAIGGFLYYQLITPRLTSAMVFEIKAGEHKREVANKLAARQLMNYPSLFATYMYAQQQTIKHGEYLFKPGSSLASIWLQISQGKGFYYYAFTIVPGWTVKQLRAALLAAPAFYHQAVYQNDEAWSNVLGVTTLPEGIFLPETYFYTKGTSDWVVLKKAKQLMDAMLTVLWAHRVTDVPFKTPYEALIAASLIEKEAYYHDERPVIAGVLVNRLKKNMLLQFDPSVIYGLHEKYTGHLRSSDLKEKTPYNTYLNKGLPPTPIAVPSMGSIEAVLHPAQHDYLYFVVKQAKRHQFSSTLIMHNAAVNAYRNQEKQTQ